MTHSRHVRSDTKPRWYHDDTELVLSLRFNNDNKFNPNTMLITLESKLFSLEKQLHEINTFLVSSTLQVILHNKPIFDNEKLKILRLKGQLTSLYCNNLIIIQQYTERFVMTTQFSEWNRIAKECNRLIDQLQVNAPPLPPRPTWSTVVVIWIKAKLSSLLTCNRRMVMKCRPDCLYNWKRTLAIVINACAVIIYILYFFRVSV